MPFDFQPCRDGNHSGCQVAVQLHPLPALKTVCGCGCHTPEGLMVCNCSCPRCTYRRPVGIHCQSLLCAHTARRIFRPYTDVADGPKTAEKVVYGKEKTHHD
jgi:hypothetical protein